jgi:transposase
MEELRTMSTKELDRALVMARLVECSLSQQAAADMLQVTMRQVRRLLRAYEAQGVSALASKRRGKPSNRKLALSFREHVMALVKARYADFGPTLACEKLREQHDASVSVETLRHWMAAEGLWRTRSDRRKPAQQPRRRRASLGELVQIDGSDHEWFEDRGPRCTLLVYIDDATGRLMELHFTRSESTFGYFAATESYLRKHGKPGAFYSDKASIFRVNAKAAVGGDGFAQFGRAMDDLNIDVICANTPAAKGRVERANQTLQDRLVKELRLRGISDRDAANAFMVEFCEDFNRRFAREPQSPHDAHRPMLGREKLEHIFTWQEERRLTGNLTLHYKRVMYLIEPCPAAESARGKRVLVREDQSGCVVVEYKGMPLAAHAFPKDARVRQGAIVENKLLGHTLTLIQAYQQERDANTLRTARLTLRDEDLMRKSMGEVGLPNGRRRRKPRTYPAPILTATVNSDVDPLATVLAWGKQQAPG